MGTSASLLVARLELALGISTPVPLAGSPFLPSVGHSRGRRVVLVCIHCQKAFTMLLPWMHPSRSVSLPSVWGGCEAGLATGLGYYSDLLIFLPQSSQRLYCGWDIGSFLTPPGGQFLQPVYPSCCQGSQAATMDCLTPTSVPTSGSHPTHWPCLDTPIDGRPVLWRNISLNSQCPDLLLWPFFPCLKSLPLVQTGKVIGRFGGCLQEMIKTRGCGRACSCYSRSRARSLLTLSLTTFLLHHVS